MLRHETQVQQMISHLRTRLLVMCATTSIAFDEAVDSLQTGSMGKAVAVVEGDAAINALERELDDLCLSLLVRAQPVAGDLRFAIGTLRMINDLERVGDEAVVIAERVTTCRDESYKEIALVNAPLAVLAKKTLHEALTSFKEQDITTALAICRLTDEIVQEELAVIQSIMRFSKNQDHSLSPYTAMHSILVCRSLNRICRRAINIAEHTYFIYTGESIKHCKM